MQKKTTILIIVIIVLLLVGGVYWWWGQKYDKFVSEKQLEIIPQKGDVFGVEPDTKFILKTKIPLSSDEIQDKLKITPAVSFEVKSNSEGNFEILPKEDLKVGKVYQIVFPLNDKNLSWAFEAKPSFKVISTTPRNESVDIPLNAGIEIVFNRQEFKNPEQFFEITPEVKGRFEEKGETLIFIPAQNFKEGAVYQVKIKKGLSLENSNDVLPEDFVFTFETTKGEKDVYFSFASDFIEVLPQNEPALGVSYNGINIENQKFNLYQFSTTEEFLESYNNYKNKFPWALYQPANFNPDPNEKILSFQPKIIEEDKNIIVIPQLLKEGYYLLETEVNGEKTFCWLESSLISNYFAKTNDNALVWTLDFQNKTPLENAKIKFFNQNEEFITDKNGLATFSTPEYLRNEDLLNFLIIEKDGYLKKITPILEKQYYYQWGVEDYYFDYFNTDRYLYRTDDTVHFWGAVKGRNESLIQKSLRVELVSSFDEEGDEPILEQNVVVSNYGTISGDFSFKNLSPGFYILNLYFGDQSISSTYFETGIFSKPLYQIKVTPEKENIFLGESAIFKVKAEFFDGTPLPSEKLKYKTYFKGENKEGEIILDENGEGEIKVESKYTGSTAETYWPSSFDITVWPALFEEGEIEGRAEINVFGPKMELKTFNEYNGNKVKITAKLNEIDLTGDKENIGKPVTNYPLDLEVKEITWQKVKTGQKYDYIEKTFYDVFEYKKDEKVIDNLSGKTNQNGEWILERELNPEKDYQFTFKGKDRGGNEFKETDYINISLYNNLSGDPYSIYLKNDEKRDYQIGENVPLVLEKNDATPFSPNEKFLFLGFQNKIEKTIFSDVPEASFTFEENYIPNIQFIGVWLSKRGFVESNDVNFPFDISQKTLQINISTDKEKYRPGENVNLTVETKKDNNLKKSEAKIAVIDEALLALDPDYYNNTIFNFYDNVFTNPFTTFSQYLIPKTEAAESGGCFGQGTKILMEDGKQKNIEEIKPGDVILTKEAENYQSSLLPAVVQHVASYFVQDYLLINNDLKITPEHKVFLNGKWQEAIKAKKGDFLLDKDGKNIEIKTIEIKHKPAKVYNIIVGDYHTFFANGIFVHNEEKGAETRENFLDLAFYQTVELKNGSQNVNFKLPDNLTSWRIIVEAISDDADIGKTTKNINVSLPFFVNLTLNENYLLEDSPQIIAKAFGEKYKKGTPVSFTLSLPELNYQKTIQTTEGSVAFELPQVLKEGEYQVKLEGHWQGYSDAILRKIKFQKTPLQNTALKLYSLSEDLTQVEGNKEGITHLVFLDKIKGRVYPILKENLSSVGERVEEKIAPYFASQLLKEYFNEENDVEEIDFSSYITNNGISLVPWGGDDVLTSAMIANLSPETFLKHASPSYFNEILESDERTNLDKSIALFGLASLSEPVLSKINLFEKYNALNLEEEIYLTLARASLGDYETAREIYFKEIRPNLTFRSDVFYLNLNDNNKDKEIKLSGLLASLCAILNEEDQFGLSEYLFQNNPSSDLKNLESLIYIKNFLSNYPSNYAASFDYKIEEKEGSIDLSQGKVFKLDLLPEELSNLKFSNIKGDIQLQSWFQKPITKEELKKSDTISLSKTFILNEKEATEFQQGDLVLVKLNPNFMKNAPDGLYTITDWLPAGLKPVVQSFRNEQWEKSTECNLIGHPFSFEGNKVSFLWTKEFDKSKNCPDKDISYYARVVTPGTYKAPAAILQSLKASEVITTSDEYIIKIK